MSTRRPTDGRNGDPLAIPASTFNAFIDAAEDLHRRRHDQGRSVTPVAGRQTGVVLVKNSSGADRSQSDVLGIDGVLLAPSVALDAFKNTVALNGVIPSAANHAGRFVILLEPAGTNQLVRACVAGVTPVRVNVTAEADAFADVNDGVPGTLQSGASGSAQILWKEAGTGTKWAAVRIGAPSVASGGTATVCRVVEHVSGAVYSVIEQTMSGEATFADAVGATAYHATNVGEIGNGPGGAVDDNALVLVAASGAYHVFSYPPYAKYRN